MSVFVYPIWCKSRIFLSRIHHFMDFINDWFFYHNWCIDPDISEDLSAVCDEVDNVKDDDRNSVTLLSTRSHTDETWKLKAWITAIFISSKNNTKTKVIIIIIITTILIFMNLMKSYTFRKWFIYDKWIIMIYIITLFYILIILISIKLWKQMLPN